ncbi:zinc finger MYM-type protein 1-like [Dendronephthya gigantea]|uniref:zinc finger MYM-type protein 1-like n=1 Tax=Dendronephthya gigantea TaxID=151771 RepID=UPI00106C6F48|nr:zinc finger MYM-type protein 1-like [Dendronephthya gigantea]
MTKWALAKANHMMNTSVLKQMDNAHKQYVFSNRQYLQVIIECLMYNAQQNVAIRGPEEDRKRIWEVSDVNRGNLLELLHFRCKDLPWLKTKLETQHKEHIQWTSPKIQNELIEIVSSLVLQRIARDVKSSGHYSVIVDETSDISRAEQVSLCLRYVVEGETRETFARFFATESTEGEVLYELVKKTITNLNLVLSDIVGECFDGAANMSGCHKGVASRMKECSPLALYVHCYAHRLNLALQNTMTSIEPIRNALGTMQSLYNFIEASPKRHSIFQNIQVEDEHSELTLKSMSVTRWSCRWQAVKAVFEKMPSIIRVLLRLSSDLDVKTYTDSNNLLNVILNLYLV